MIKLSPVLDQCTISKYFPDEKFGSATPYAYTAFEGEQLIGVGLFLIQDFSQVIFEDCFLDPDDVFVFDGIFRGGISFALSKKIQNAKFSKKTVDLSSFLGYNIIVSEKNFDIPKFFSDNRQCK